MEPVNRTSERLRGLVNELDDKLASTRTDAEQLRIDGIEIIPDRPRVPRWFGIVAVVLLGVGLGALIVQPWKDRCSYGRDVCRIAQLDIDVLRLAIPDSELLATLPNIDALDPNDELTAGDIFAMDRFEGLDFGALLTEDEIDLLLGR